MMKIFIAVVALLLADAVHASSTAELTEIADSLKAQRDAWAKDVEKFNQRQAEKTAEREALGQAPEKVRELTEKSEKSLIDAMRSAAKGVSPALGGSDLKKAKAGLDVTEKSLKASKDLQAQGIATNELIDGTVDKKISVVDRQLVDLKNKIAIYNAFIAGVQTNIDQVNQAIETQRTQEWAAFFNKVAEAQRAAQGRVDARHAAEKAAAEQAAKDAQKSNSTEPHEHGNGADHRPTKDPGNQNPGPKDTGPKDTGPKDTGPKDTGPKDGGVEIHKG